MGGLGRAGGSVGGGGEIISHELYGAKPVTQYSQ